MDLNKILNNFREELSLINQSKREVVEVIRKFNIAVEEYDNGADQEPVIDIDGNIGINDNNENPIADGSGVAHEMFKFVV